MIQRAAAKSWDVPVDEIVTEKSHVLHIPSNRREPYATFTDEIAQ